MSKSRQILSELKARGFTRPLNESEKILRWFDSFVEYFLETSDHGDQEAEDDLLFFIRSKDGQSPTSQGTRVFVQRKIAGSSAVPRLEGLVAWEETFYVNLVARMGFEVRAAIVQETQGQRLLKKTVTGRVFAEPSRKNQKGVYEDAFPLIYFTVHNGEELFKHIVMDATDQVLCLEVRALLGDEIAERQTDPEPSDVYGAWENTVDTAVIYQGAVGYSSLCQIHRRKAGIRTGLTQSILMRGPEGRGYAQVSVRDSEGSTSTWSGLLQRLRPDQEHRRSRETLRLECWVESICLHWRLIVLDLYRHLDSFPPLIDSVNLS